MKKTFAILLAVLLAGMGATLSAWAGEPRKIAITLDDMLRIHPDHITAKAGETVDFVVHNQRQVPHEFVIGNAKELDEHALEMQNMSGMDMASMPASKSKSKQEKGVELVDVEPGKTGHLIYHFKKAGTLSFACLYPGHREAGMKGTITVK